MTAEFPTPSPDKSVLEAGEELTPRFDQAGLITAVVTDAADGMLLMVAHMNAAALRLSIETGVAHYYSRSRQALWKKGETSGNLQHVEEIRIDCDQDAVWLKVRVAGQDASCHTGRRSCFYRRIVKQDDGSALAFDDEAPRFDPAKVYGHSH